MLAITPFRIYNTANNESKRPKHIRKRQFVVKKPEYFDPVEIHRLREQVSKYKRGQAKLKRLAQWNMRSAKSSIKDIQETLEILEDLYGDEAFDEEPEWASRDE